MVIGNWRARAPNTCVRRGHVTLMKQGSGGAAAGSQRTGRAQFRRGATSKDDTRALGRVKRNGSAPATTPTPQRAANSSAAGSARRAAGIRSPLASMDANAIKANSSARRLPEKPARKGPLPGPVVRVNQEKRPAGARACVPAPAGDQRVLDTPASRQRVREGAPVSRMATRRADTDDDDPQRWRAAAAVRDSVAAAYCQDDSVPLLASPGKARTSMPSVLTPSHGASTMLMYASPDARALIRGFDVDRTACTPPTPLSPVSSPADLLASFSDRVQRYSHEFADEARVLSQQLDRVDLSPDYKQRQRLIKTRDEGEGEGEGEAEAEVAAEVEAEGNGDVEKDARASDIASTTQSPPRLPRRLSSPRASPGGMPITPFGPMPSQSTSSAAMLSSPKRASRIPVNVPAASSVGDDTLASLLSVSSLTRSQDSTTRRRHNDVRNPVASVLAAQQQASPPISPVRFVSPSVSPMSRAAVVSPAAMHLRPVTLRVPLREATLLAEREGMHPWSM